MMKRILAAALAIAMALTITACTPADNALTPQAGERAEVSMVIGSHVSWPYNENWVAWDYIQEATNTTLNITAIPGQDFATKLPLMLTSPETLPDILHTWMKETVDDNASSGAYVSYDDNMDLMPNYQAFLDSLSETEYSELTAQHTSGDGKMYSSISTGKTSASGYTWMYRKDIFEKHDLKVPTTAEELYQVAKKLKELYPDSYPLCFRDGLGKLIIWGPSWQDYFTFRTYYDYNKGEWKYGVLEPVAKEMVEYFLKLGNEGLVPPDYITMPTKSWEELMSTDRGFITIDYVVRLDFFNNANRATNPDYTLALMAPPVPDTPQAEPRLMKANIDLSGFCVFNTGKQDRIENAFKFIDWYYSDEAYELMSWGKQGETYEMVDGARKFILQGDETPQMKYGLGTYGTYSRSDPKANEESYTPEQVSAFNDVKQYLEDYGNPDQWLTYSKEETTALAALSDDIKSYVEEGLSKFMLGQRPMDEWDEFVSELGEMNIQEVLDINKSAFDRATQD